MTCPRSIARALAAGSVVLVIGVAGCGDDDDGTTATTVAGTEGTATEGTGTTEDRETFAATGVASLGTEGEAAECVVDAVIDGVGFETISATGTTADAFWSASSPLADVGLTAESPEVTAVAEGITACEGAVGVIAATGGQTVTAEQEACLAEAEVLDDFGMGLALQLVGADPAAQQTEFRAAADTCGI